MVFAFHTLGCKVNQYETQAMEELLLAKGHTLVPFEEKADVYIINSCTVTAVSDKKSRQAVRQARRRAPEAVVALCGCYPQVSPEEAAKLDGCGNTRFFFHIVLPLSGAITAILVLYYGQGHWNSYFSALLYINDREKWPLQLELRNILLLNTNTMTKEFITEEMRKEQARREALANMMKYSLIIISSIPMLIVYPFVQKHFVKGVMIGSVKG